MKQRSVTHRVVTTGTLALASGAVFWFIPVTLWIGFPQEFRDMNRSLEPTLNEYGRSAFNFAPDWREYLLIVAVEVLAILTLTLLVWSTHWYVNIDSGKGKHIAPRRPYEDTVQSVRRAERYIKRNKHGVARHY